MEILAYACFLIILIHSYLIRVASFSLYSPFLSFFFSSSSLFISLFFISSFLSISSSASILLSWYFYSLFFYFYFFYPLKLLYICASIFVCLTIFCMSPTSFFIDLFSPFLIFIFLVLLSFYLSL